MTGEWALEFTGDLLGPMHMALPITMLEFADRDRALVIARQMWVGLTEQTTRGSDGLLYPRSPSLVWRQHLSLTRSGRPAVAT